jgi:DNA repair exonuclease SbcCD ATPase subunit
LPAQDYDREIVQTRTRIEELKKASGEDKSQKKEEIERLEAYLKSLLDNRQVATVRDNELKQLRARVAELEPRSEKAERRVRVAKALLDSTKSLLDIETEEHGSTTDTAKHLRAEMEWLGSELAGARRAADKWSDEIAQQRRKVDELQAPLKKAEADLREATAWIDSFGESRYSRNRADFDMAHDIPPNVLRMLDEARARQLPKFGAELTDGELTLKEYRDLARDAGTDIFLRPTKTQVEQRVRWEYKVMTIAEVRSLGNNDLGAGLNRLGDEGLELVSIDKDQCVLKRSK